MAVASNAWRKAQDLLEEAASKSHDEVLGDR